MCVIGGLEMELVSGLVMMLAMIEKLEGWWVVGCDGALLFVLISYFSFVSFLVLLIFFSS